MENFPALMVKCEAPSIRRKGVRPFDRSKTQIKPAPPPQDAGIGTKIFVIEGDHAVRAAIEDLLSTNGYAGEYFDTCPNVLPAPSLARQGCILIDAGTFVAGSARLRSWLRHNAPEMTIIVMAFQPTLAKAVEVMRAGAGDFIGKPFYRDELLASIRRAASPRSDAAGRTRFREVASTRVATLTARQHQIMDLIVAGHPSKNIAADLNISQRTVENHRASIARKTGSKSLANVIQTALCADCIFCRETSNPDPSGFQ